MSWNLSPEPAMRLAEAIGYFAAALVFLTFSMKTMVPLRIVGITSNIFFIAYGYLNPAYPLLVLHCALLPLNIFRLRQILNLVKQIDSATAGDLNKNWLKPFTTTRVMKAGETLFHRNEQADAMYYLLSGRYRLAELGIDLKPGEVVGELGLLNPDKSRTQSLQCVEDGEILQITYEQVRQLYFQNPKFGFYFLQLSTSRLFENIGRLEHVVAERDAEIATLRREAATAS
jgi:CRP/FNR family cyclic AMP-dependent transcriptional regulator